MITQAVKYADLLRKEYRAGELDPSTGFLDCFGVHLAILGRLDALHGQIGVDAGLRASGSEMLSRAAQGDSPWHRIGSKIRDARQLGDAVAIAREDGHVGLWTLVRVNPPTFITAIPEAGVMASRAREWGEILGVYRIREVAR